MPEKSKKKVKLKKILAGLPVVKRVISWSKQNSMIGFSNIPIYNVISFIINEIKKDSIITRANSIAFSFFLSIFPSLLALITLIPLVLPFFEEFLLPYISQDLIIVSENGSTDIKATLLNQLNNILTKAELIPKNAIDTFNQFAADLLLQPRIGLFSFGYILALFFASNGMMQLMRGFEKSAHNSTFIKRNALQSRLESFRLLFTLVGVLLLSIVSIIIGNYIFPNILERLKIGGAIFYLMNILRWILTLVLFYTGISLTYRYGIATKEKVKFFSSGATLATFLSVASSLIFAFYVDSFNRYNELYGSIGTIIVVMLWIQINTIILLIGFELNASIQINKPIFVENEDSEEEED